MHARLPVLGAASVAAAAAAADAGAAVGVTHLSAMAELLWLLQQTSDQAPLTS
jgi:hypothetical protein